MDRVVRHGSLFSLGIIAGCSRLAVGWLNESFRAFPQSSGTGNGNFTFAQAGSSGLRYLGRELHAAKEFLEAWVGAERIEPRVLFHEYQNRAPGVISLGEPYHRPVSLAVT